MRGRKPIEVSLPLSLPPFPSLSVSLGKNKKKEKERKIKVLRTSGVAFLELCVTSLSVPPCLNSIDQTENQSAALEVDQQAGNCPSKKELLGLVWEALLEMPGSCRFLGPKWLPGQSSPRPCSASCIQGPLPGLGQSGCRTPRLRGGLPWGWGGSLHHPGEPGMMTL